MNNFDLDVYEYRCSKNIKYAELIKDEHLKNDYSKISYRTRCGYVDGYLYFPNGEKQDNLGVIVMLHGGGMVLQFPEQEGEYCRLLANKTNRAVLNIDYLVAPEFKYPLPIESTYDFLEMMINDGNLKLDYSNLVIIGSSAGATLTADLCIMNSYLHKLSIAKIILNYGVYKQILTPELREAIDPEKAIAPSRMYQYLNWYFDDLTKIDEELASPLNTNCDFPDSLIIGAEYDSLLSDSIALNKRLSNSELWIAPKALHGFTHRWFKEYDDELAKIAWQKMISFILEEQA